MASRIATEDRTVAAVREHVQEAQRDAREGGASPIDPAFHRAILKIALELKKPNAPSYDQIVSATIRNLRLDPVAFRRYLGENGARNMSLLLATARTGGL